MKDYIKEFENIELIFEHIFSNILNRGKSAVNKTPSSNKPKNTVQNIKDKHSNSIENGGECKKLGMKKPDGNLFFSKIGDRGAVIGQNRNVIEDMAELKISKNIFRCFDPKSKDIYGIEWLFNPRAKFKCTKLSGSKGDIHFEGEWYDGVFKGTWEGDASNWKANPNLYQGQGLNLNAHVAANANSALIQYYILPYGSGSQKGPYLLAGLRHFYDTKAIDDDTQIYSTRTKEWKYLSDLPERNKIVPPPAPPTPPATAAGTPPPGTPPPPATPPALAKYWYADINDTVLGSYVIKQMYDFYQAGTINLNTRVWSNKLKDWVILKDLPEKNNIIIKKTK